MAKIRLRKKKRDYAQVHKNLLNDKEISLKAKGLGAWLELHEDGFELNYQFIIKNMKEGEDAVRAAVNELKGSNFLFIEKDKNKKGLFLYIWHFDSEGVVLECIQPYGDYPHMDNPDVDEPHVDNTAQIIKHKQKNINKKISSKKTESFNAFRERMKNEYLGLNLVQGVPGLFLKNTVISLSSTGYLHNEVSAKDISAEDAKRVWAWMYSNQDAIMPKHKEVKAC